ncbi:hypothetical protein ACF8D3_03300 [Acinetobacter sp. YQ_14]|uniref:hypothetical protein n=1 Tax=Acinetobacter sp. YQ_14 TaxID=3367236 RepID=UPI00370AC497
MEILAGWLIKCGIGYNEFSSSLRILFYNQAIKELESIPQKKTDSSISLLSGLPRRDVSMFRQQNDGHTTMSLYRRDTSVSVPARVIGLWLIKKLSYKIPFSNSSNSFENLVKEISLERHPRSILLELKRLGILFEEDDYVILNTNSFTPSPESSEINKIFTSNACDFLSAGIANVTKKENKFLEQAVYADELTDKSINILKEFSYQIWENASDKILSKAIECCKEDEGRKDATNRFKFGVYEYYENYQSDNN